MDFFTAVEKRHSFRGKYKNDPVPDSDIKKIVDAGLRAPSGCNAQTTYFTVVTNKELHDGIVKLFDMECVATAPVIIVAYTKKVKFDFGLDFELEDYGAAVENILLAATALGYASLWVDGTSRLDGRNKELAKLLDIPADYEVRTILPVGVPEKHGTQASRKPFEERVVWK